MTARRPADIGRSMRARWGYGAEPFADELDALDARWPTADEIAEMRGDVATLRGPWTGDATVHGVAARLSHLLDRLDPPQPEPQADDDVDPWTLLAEMAQPGGPTFSQLAAARAALDARGQRTAVDCSDCSHPISGHDVDDGSCRYCNCPEARP